ncbi:MAG: DNA polymerase III subunit gamma/tau [Coprobacillus cateniformis]
MAYKTLYRVYRPQRFDEVAGQEHIITTLRHAVEENKIAHAYLFCGPRGTGKTTIAKLLAKAINCTGNPKPCDECENCKEIASGNHPDVIEIDAASNNGVDEVRNLIDKVKYAPTQGKYKVYIIDEVHMMSTGAFNALLKTLEEPPAHVVFILATTEPHKILPTIISRCQRFDFMKLSLTEIVNRMKSVVEQENYICDDEALEMIAKLADGGMRDALSILEQCLAYNDQHLTVQDVNHIYGIVSLENKIDFIKVLLSKDMKKSLFILDEMKTNGIDIKRLTLDLVDILKDIIIYRNTSDSSILLFFHNII